MRLVSSNLANYHATVQKLLNTTSPDQTGGAENAGVKNAGVIKYGKPSKHKTVRCLMPPTVGRGIILFSMIANPNLGYTLH